MSRLQKLPESQVVTRIAPGGRVVIPAAIRKELDLAVGDQVLLRLEEGELRVSSRKQAIERLQQRLRELTKDKRSLADELIAERRLEAARE